MHIRPIAPITVDLHDDDDLAGLKACHPSVHGIGIPVLDLARDPVALRQAMIDAGRRAAVDDVGETLILGGTALQQGGRVFAGALAEEGIRIGAIERLPPTIGLAATPLRPGLAHASRAWPLPAERATPGHAA